MAQPISGPGNRNAFFMYEGDISEKLHGEVVDRLIQVWKDKQYTPEINRNKLRAFPNTSDEGRHVYEFFFRSRTGLSGKFLSLFSDKELKEVIPEKAWYEMALQAIKLTGNPEDIRALNENAPPSVKLPKEKLVEIKDPELQHLINIFKQAVR